ncbi:MAG: PspA/IM30 family protein [Candidatus Sumerlaeota bacterium]|nr:PspA/IM30 family protein [Candidatus Sumerlaeota bacterium]
MFRRIGNLIRGFFSLFISGLEKRNPEALLEVEKENLREQISRYNQGLASHAALCERLMSQVKSEETQERDLRAKTSAHLKAGNRDAAAQYALQLQTLQQQLQENRSQMEQAEKTYTDLMQAREVTVRAAQTKIENLKAMISDMKIKQAVAEMSEMATGMIGSIGGSGDTLNRLEDMVREQRDKAAGRARVARDSIDLTDVRLKEGEQKALADQALADFAAKEGIVLEGAPAAGAPTPAAEGPAKTMGPAPETEKG